MTEVTRIIPGELTLEQLRKLYNSKAAVQIIDSAWGDIDKAQQVVRDIIDQGAVVYGVNTGFGVLASTRIDRNKLSQLQRNLLVSHSVGVGDLLPDETVRLIMILKVASLARGYSGVSRDLVKGLLNFINKGVYPCVPSKGSVGASGDLAPLAHMASVLIGEGEARYQGERMSAKDALERAGLNVIELGPKEGIGLINGTQVSTALALVALFKTENLFASAVVAGALCTDAALGTNTMFDPRIQAIRLQEGQIGVAAVYAKLLDGSDLLRSHTNCERVQDPYSLRCQPQVMGACLDHMRFSANIFLRDANAVTDNPLVFTDNGEVISGGNFHAQPIAMASDVLALAIAEIGSLSERRTSLMMDQHMSHLPPFLVRDSGLNSGFMIMQVTAAALASENKSLAHPASVDSLPTSANQEDHVSMATFAARRLHEMIDNSVGVVAIEIISALQGIDLRSPTKTSPELQRVHTMVRSKVAPLMEDRSMAKDIGVVKEMIYRDDFNAFAGNTVFTSWSV